MSFDFATVASELESFLKPLVPQTWLVQDAFIKLNAPRKTVLTYAQGNVLTRIDGQGLGAGSVAVEFALVLSTPETDATKGWPRLNKEAVHLFAALDSHPQILWTDAERGVLQSGESIYVIPIQVLTTYNTQE